jgi:hypothetical protein
LWKDEFPMREFDRARVSLKTALNPVAELPILVLPSVLKLPIWVNVDPSDPTVVEPILV